MKAFITRWWLVMIICIVWGFAFPLFVDGVVNDQPTIEDTLQESMNCPEGMVVVKEYNPVSKQLLFMDCIFMIESHYDTHRQISKHNNKINEGNKRLGALYEESK